MCLLRVTSLTLELKKFSDPNEDAYFKDFLALLDTDSKVGNDLGIIKVAFVRDSSKCSIAKIQISGYKTHEDIGGFVGMFLFDSVDDIKDNSDVMKDIFGNVENLEVGNSILMADWKNWSNDAD